MSTVLIDLPVEAPVDSDEDEPNHFWCSDCYPDGGVQLAYCGRDITDLDEVTDTCEPDEDCVLCDAVDNFYDGCPRCGR